MNIIVISSDNALVLTEYHKYNEINYYEQMHIDILFILKQKLIMLIWYFNNTLSFVWDFK